MNKKKQPATIEKKKVAKIKRTKRAKAKPKSVFDHVDEQEFLEVLNKITKKLIHKFRFGYHSAEDMKQQASIFAMEALERYDGKRPLENFLWTHVRNRLFNFKRNNYQRPDSPCVRCPLYDQHLKSSTSGCLKYTEKTDCSLYDGWFKRNENKKNIMQPSFIDNDQEYFFARFDMDNVGDKEIINHLDIHVRAEHREYYLKLKHGVKINKEKFDKLKNHITTLIKDYSLSYDRET